MKFVEGNRVRVNTSSGLFNRANSDKTGVVDSRRDSQTVYVRFDDGLYDYGRDLDLTLVVEAGVSTGTVKDKLEQIEKLLAEIKETLY